MAQRAVSLKLFAMDKDGKKAREALWGAAAFYLAAMPKSTLTDVYGIGAELAELAAGARDGFRGSNA